NPFASGITGIRGATTTHTFGARYVGDNGRGFLWDFEGMIQFGEFAGRDLFAGAATVGLGYQTRDIWGLPMFWAYYDWASGSSNPVGPEVSTFNQLFPFGHYYFGFIDVVGRKNIHDVSAITTFWPTNWIACQVQCHNFFLDSPRDFL